MRDEMEHRKGSDRVRVAVALAINLTAATTFGSVARGAQPPGWEADRRLTRSDSASTTSINFARSVAVDEAGRVHLAWVENGSGKPELFYKRSIDAGVTWGPPIRLLDSPNQAFNPSIAAGGGLVIIAWQDTRPGGARVYARRSIDGGAHWLGEVALTSESAGSPSIALEGRRVHLVYGRPLGDNELDVYYRRSLNRGRTWQDEVRISNLPGNSWVPTVAATGSRVYVGWADTTNSPRPCCLEEEYFARSADRGATWSAPERLTFDPQGSPANSWAPSLAADGATVWMVWFDDRSGDWEIYAKSSQDYGQTWSADRRLTFSPGVAVRPSIARRGNELFVAYWDSRPGDGEETYLLRSPDRGVTWRAPQRLTFAQGGSTLASIAAGEHGVHIVWTDTRDGNAEVYYKRLAGAPVKIGNGLIAFSRQVGGVQQIYTAQPDGTNERQLTFVGDNSYPVWSKDGSRLLFVSTRAGGFDLWVMEPNGSNATQLTHGGGSFLGDWSYDGTQIAFTSNLNGPSNRTPVIWIMNTDGTGMTRLTTDTAPSVHASFAPGDSAIYFGSRLGATTQVWGMLPDGRGLEQKTNGLGPSYPEANVPTWSRTGLMAFWAGFENQFGEVWVWDPRNGDGPRQVTTTVDPFNSDNPSWSPDGTTILFDSNRKEGSVSIWSIHPDGSDLRELIPGGSGQTSWQPIAVGGGGDR